MPPKKKHKSKPKSSSIVYKHAIKPAHRTIAKQVIQDGVPLKTAMMSAGYAKSTSSGGYHNLKRRFPSLWDAMQEEMQAWVKATKNLPKPAERANIATARLLINAAAGEDGGTAAAKLLWQDREVNRLTPDAQIGIFNMAVPHDLKEFFTLPPGDPDAPFKQPTPIVDIFAQSEELLTSIRSESTEDTDLSNMSQSTTTNKTPDRK